MSTFEQLRRLFEAQSELRRTTCRLCEGPLKPHVGRGRPRETCVACRETSTQLKIKPAPRICQRCGSVFCPAKNNHQKFCSERCQRRCEPSRVRVQRWARICQRCGKGMTGRLSGGEHSHVRQLCSSLSSPIRD